MASQFSHNQPQPQTEEIIKLRLQFVKVKKRLQNYDKFISLMDQFNKQIDVLLQKFHRIDGCLFQICSQVGIQSQPLRMVWKEAEVKGKWESIQDLQNMLHKHQELIKTFQKEQLLIANVAKNVKQIVGESKAHMQKHHKLEREHKECEQKLSQVSKHNQKMKLVEKEIKIKELEIMELNKMKEELQYNLAESSRKIEEQEVKIRELEGDLEQRQKDYIKIQERQSEEQAITFQQQNIKEKCSNLIEMLEVGPEDYLTHYFRSNGLPLDGQRPQKNKYAMAFE